MSKPSFQEQVSQLLSAYMQQESPRNRSVEGFAAFLDRPTETPPSS